MLFYDGNSTVQELSGATPAANLLLGTGEVREGDLVLAYDKATGTTGWYPVTAMHEHIDHVSCGSWIVGEQERVCLGSGAAGATVAPDGRRPQ